MGRLNLETVNTTTGQNHTITLPIPKSPVHCRSDGERPQVYLAFGLRDLPVRFVGRVIGWFGLAKANAWYLVRCTFLARC